MFKKGILMSDKSKRKINEPDNTVGSERKEYYKNCFEHISSAQKNGFWLEVITLCESMISDRLESRLAWINNQSSDSRQFRTLGSLRIKLGKNDSVPESSSILEEVKEWASKRNRALHQMVKLAEAEEGDWRSKYDQNKEVAEAGIDLFRKVDSYVRKYNKVLNENSKELGKK
jgi:hypothetical protein